jgi:hypothetical protein
VHEGKGLRSSHEEEATSVTDASPTTFVGRRRPGAAPNLRVSNAAACLPGLPGGQARGTLGTPGPAHLRVRHTAGRRHARDEPSRDLTSGKGREDETSSKNRFRLSAVYMLEPGSGTLAASLHPVPAGGAARRRDCLALPKTDPSRRALRDWLWQRSPQPGHAVSFAHRGPADESS